MEVKVKAISTMHWSKRKVGVDLWTYMVSTVHYEPSARRVWPREGGDIYLQYSEHRNLDFSYSRLTSKHATYKGASGGAMTTIR